MTKKLAVVGIGNTLRRDDGVGIVIVESLLKFFKKQEIDYFIFDNTSFNLPNIENYDTVLLIDGISAGLGIGEFLFAELKDIEGILNNSVASTHELNLKGVLEISRNLGIKTKIYLAGIQVGSTSFGEGLSEGLNNKKDTFLKQINSFINTFSDKPCKSLAAERS